MSIMNRGKQSRKQRRFIQIVIGLVIASFLLSIVAYGFI